MQWNAPLPADAVEGTGGHIADHDAIRASLIEIRSNVDTFVPTYIQQTEPSVTGKAVWYQTDGSGVIIKKWIQTS